MDRVRLLNVPYEWVESDKSLIRLYSLEDLVIFPRQFYLIKFGDMEYNIDSNVIGVPFKDREVRTELSLYYPEGSFSWRGGSELQLAVKNTFNTNLTILKGQMLAKVKFMTEQYFNLMKRHDNSDKGLRSAPIKIELRYES